MPIKRKLMVAYHDYTEILLLMFNKIVALSRKDKQARFMFTNLNLLMKDQKEFCLALTSNSYILQIQPDFFEGLFQPLENSIINNYS